MPFMPTGNTYNRARSGIFTSSLNLVGSAELAGSVRKLEASSVNIPTQGNMFNNMRMV